MNKILISYSKLVTKIMNNNITAERLKKMITVLNCRQKDLSLVLANIHDPHNVSAIYRSCDAFGVDTIHLYYTHTNFPVLSRKSSGSARKWIESVKHKNIDSLFQSLTQNKQQILCTSCSKNAKPFDSYDLSLSTAIILGNEHSGVDAELSLKAHGEIYIPMYGMIQSFNVSVAAAILLAEAARQRKAKGMYEQPSYTTEEFEQRLNEWMKK